MDSGSILNYLAMISNANIMLNFTMHLVVLLAVASVFLVTNIKLKRILFYGSILTLYLSVTINALVYGNPFHLVTFGVLTVMALAELLRNKEDVLIPKIGLDSLVALVFILIGFWYPEFVKVNVLQSFLFSPVGIVPCPTTLVTLGLMTLCHPKVSKMLYIAAITGAIVYGAIGTFKFGVYLDVTLLLLVIYSAYRLVFIKDTDKAGISL